ncbi:MAG: aromatic ring-hydroxylating dioxygenase subunit alpha [Chloroflexi bacterium]|nr:aromatic ring-hydroxylating dioxygenase subunit alpha [Chloroflexota bacterium]
MLTAEQNERLTLVGPGTPMGELMRRYWQPIAAYAELSTNPTKAIRLLGEDLVLYKDRSGTLGLLEASCAHRRVHLLYGIPEDNGLRCPYHGWLYDASGQCLEMPAEAPESTFPSRVQLKAYPVAELGGLVFAYLGPAPAPVLPHWGPFVAKGVVRSIGWAVVPCNWLQIMENSLDPVHGEYNHQYFCNYVLERMGILDDRGDLLGERPAQLSAEGESFWRKGATIRHHKKVGFTAFEHGILKHRLYAFEDEETSLGWRIGHPILFPNYEHGGLDHFQIRVPMDDTHTYYLWYRYSPPRDGEQASDDPDDVNVYKVPMPGLDGDMQPVWGLMDNNSGQDNMMWTSQGPIMQRPIEKLGQSDVGIIMFRRMLFEQLAVMEDGGDPMNVFRKLPPDGEHIVVPVEELDPAAANDPVYSRAAAVATQGRKPRIGAGNTQKYDPVLLRHTADAGGTLPPPPPSIEIDMAEAAPG